MQYNILFIILLIGILAINAFAATAPMRMPNNYNDALPMCTNPTNVYAYDNTNASCVDGSGTRSVYFWNDTNVEQPGLITQVQWGVKYAFSGSVAGNDNWALGYGIATTPGTCSGITYITLASGTGAPDFYTYHFANLTNTSATSWTDVNNTCWNLTITRASGSDSWTMQIDGFHVNVTYTPNSPPQWSNNLTSIASGSQYNPSNNYGFEVNWTDPEDGLGGVSQGLFFTNLTGSNKTFNKSSTPAVNNNTAGTYWINFTSIAAGTYFFQWKANDTYDMWNSSDTWIYTITKIPINITLWLNDTENNKSYAQGEVANFTAKVNVTGSNVSLASNYTGWVIQSGITSIINYTTLSTTGNWWNITAYPNDTQNYSFSLRTYFFNVTSGGTAWLNVTLNEPNSTYQTPSNPLEVIQNNTFWINSTIKCISSNCGSVNTSARYNESGTTPNKLINTTNDTPFYIIESMGGSSSIFNKVKIGNSTRSRSDNFYGAFTRKLFHAKGRYWAFNANYTHLVFTSSTDDVTWAEPTVFFDPSDEANGGLQSLYWDGTYLHVGYISTVSAGALYYKRGTPASDGTISWEAERTPVSSAYKAYFTITEDTNDYPWLAYSVYATSAFTPYVIKATATDGSSWGTPVQLDSTAGTIAPIILPLAGGKMYAIWCYYDTTEGNRQIRGKYYNGASWESMNTTDTNIKTFNYYSATSINDTVYLVYLKGTSNNLAFRNWTLATGWSSEETLETSQGANATPVITSDSFHNIFVFWYNHTGSIKFKKRINYTWGSSEDYPQANALTAWQSFSSYFRVYDNNIGIGWEEGTSTPWNITHTHLTPYPNPISCGTLTAGQSCYVSWLVNATGSLNSRWTVDVNASSLTVSENHSNDAYICIGTGCAVSAWLNVTLNEPNSTYQTPSNPLEVIQNNTFWINSTIKCIGGTCKSVLTTPRRNSTGISPDFLISSTRDDIPLYVNGSKNWSYSYNSGSTNVDTARAVARDSSNNIIVAGWVGGASNYNWNVTKLYPNGSQIWSYTYDSGTAGYDLAYSVAVDSQDNIIIGGRQGIASSNDAWNITKLNSSGSQVWSQMYNPTSGVDLVYGVAVDSQDNIIAVGRVATNGLDWNVTKLNSTGSLLWSYSYNSGSTNNDEPNAVAVDSQDNIIVVGYQGTNGNDWNVTKLNSTGSQLWSYSYNSGSSNADIAYGVDTDSQDNIIVVGNHKGTSNYNWNVTKLNSTGSLLWSNDYDKGLNDAAFGVAVDSSDNIIAVGIHGAVSTNDWNVTKLNSTGSLLWSYNYSGSSGDDRAYAVTTDAEKSIIVVGQVGANGNDWNVTKIGEYLNLTSCGNMAQNAMCNVSWLVNATGAIDSQWAVDTNASGSSIQANDSSNAYIKIISGGDFVSISASDAIKWGIRFGEIEQNTNDNAALNDTTGPSGGTAYNITVDTSSTVNVDIYHDTSDDLKLGGDTILIPNVSHAANNTTNLGANLFFYQDPDDLDSISLSKTFAIIGNNSTVYGCQNMTAGSNCWITYWLDVPNGQTAGDYNTTYNFCGVKTGVGSAQCS